MVFLGARAGASRGLFSGFCFGTGLSSHLGGLGGVVV